MLAPFKIRLLVALQLICPEPSMLMSLPLDGQVTVLLRHNRCVAGLQGQIVAGQDRRMFAHVHFEVLSNVRLDGSSASQVNIGSGGHDDVAADGCAD